MVTAQEEPKLGKIPLWGPLRGPKDGVLDSLGFVLRLGGDNLLTSFVSIFFGTTQLFVDFA